MGLTPSKFVPIVKKIRVKDLMVNLNSSKPVLKQIMVFMIRVAWSIAKPMPKLKVNINFIDMVQNEL